ncbi:hypothetical protein bcere0020_55180 [Bacillus cereus Rock3-29]|nr:hypothetical protein bcere0020_55180 [Bacillus cereus Rock3-29]
MVYFVLFPFFGGWAKTPVHEFTNTKKNIQDKTIHQNL